MHKLTGCLLLLLLLAAACGQAPPAGAKRIVSGEGPDRLDVNLDLGAKARGSFAFTCEFAGAGTQAVVLYHPVGDSWKPLVSCNNGVWQRYSHRIPEGHPDAELLVTGWYKTGSRWTQCEMSRWRRDRNVNTLSCPVPGGGSVTFTCSQDKCAAR